MTAVEWFAGEIKGGKLITNQKFEELLQQAKEMEKQQKHFAYQDGREDVFDWLKKMDYDFLVEQINKTE